MGKSSKRNRKSEVSKESTPVRNGGDSDYDVPQKKKKKAVKSSSELAEDLGIEDVELEYSDADFQNLTTFSLYVRLFRPQIAAANPKISSSKMSQLLEAKWREFQELNPGENEEEEDGDSPEEEEEGKNEESDVEDTPPPAHRSSKGRVRKANPKYKKADSDDQDSTEAETHSGKKTRTKASIVKKIAEKRGVTMPRVTADFDDDDDTEISEQESSAKKSSRSSRGKRQDNNSDSDGAGSSRRKKSSSKKDKSRKRGSNRSTPVVSGVESDNDEDGEEEPEEEEETPKRRSTGLLKIKLSLPSSNRKSARERKKATVDNDVEKFFEESDDGSSKKKPADSDDDFEMDSADERKSKRRSTNKRTSSKRSRNNDSDLEVLDSDEENDSRKKSKRRSVQQSRRSRGGGKRSQRNSDAGSSDDSDDDSDSEGSGPSRKKRRGGGGSSRKKAASPPRIPGERQSERNRGGGTEKGGKQATLAEMTDKEFEKMLKDQEKEEERNKRRKERKKTKKSKEFSFKGKKGAWQAGSGSEESGAGGDSGEESDHYWYCQLCKDGGDLLLCDGCPRSYHQSCLKIETLPEGDWKCPVCNGEELPELSEEEGDTGHDTNCKECRRSGELLLCDFCTFSFHLTCLNPVLQAVPEGEWKCPRCEYLERPLKGKVERILTWRWTKPEGDEAEEDKDHLDHTTSPVKKTAEGKAAASSGVPKKQPERELLCKFQYYSYWDVEWVNQLHLDVFQSQTVAFFKAKWDTNEPPQTDEIRASGKHSSDDKYNLHERYFRWGIKPDWLTIHRILTHEKEGGSTRYLVKWRDRPYEEATYEEEGDLPDGLTDWKKHVNAYWMRRKQVEGSKKDKDKSKDEKKPKKKELKKQWEVQPPYLDATGGKLHPYQLEGVNWLRFSFGQDTNTILADEMGLGKTIQAISFIYSLWKEGHAKGPFLITAPLSTVPNWEREFEFWAPDMYVITFCGSRENRAIMRERELCYREGCLKLSTYTKPSAFRLDEGYKPKFDVLLTSYEYPSLDMVLFKSFHWSTLIIDEAHRLKSNQSLFFRTLSAYKVDYRLLLTGTPLQNNLEELFNLLNFLQGEKFDNLEEFLEEFSDINKEDQIVRLHSMLAPHMLRRLKSDVLKDMPAKSEFIVRVELAPMQKKYYKLILTKNYEALNVKGYSNQTSLQNIMMDLRKCCCHPYLFPSAVDEAPISRQGYFEGSALTKACGKMVLLEKMLKKLREQGHRVLIFSQMTRMLDLLEDFLIHHNMEFERIDGGITGSLRQDKIDRFNDPNSSSFVFLLSTKAGGLGINLATADTVIIYDMDWNPHNDIQAFSRAHRIGQKNKVMIYRFVSRHTVEEKMANVCKRKMMLSELVIAKGGSSKVDVAKAKQAESLTKQEINDILKFGVENLFKDDEGGKLVYDDATVEKMLDRTLDDENEAPVAAEGETKVGLNDYLRSFKVAHYQVKEGEDEESEEEKEEEEEEEEEKEEGHDDPEYWQRILGDEYSAHVAAIQQQAEEVAKTLGKGKRIRKQINYAEQAMLELAQQSKGKRKVEVLKQKANSDDDEEFKPGDDSSDDSSVDSDELDDVNDDGLKKNDPKKWHKVKKELLKKQQIKAGKLEGAVATSSERHSLKASGAGELPPLLARVNGQIEVLGFTARQRRAFLDGVMRFGLPPEDSYRSQWLVRDLRNKPERVFKAYVSLFMRHLCEPSVEGADKFADGVPREGMSQQHVLTRTGMIALLKRKVREFEAANGTDSLKEFRGGRKATTLSDMMLTAADIAQREQQQKKLEEEQKELADRLAAAAEVAKDLSEQPKETVASSEQNGAKPEDSEKSDSPAKTDKVDGEKDSASDSGKKAEEEAKMQNGVSEGNKDSEEGRKVNGEVEGMEVSEGKVNGEVEGDSGKKDTDSKTEESMDTSEGTKTSETVKENGLDDSKMDTSDTDKKDKEEVKKDEVMEVSESPSKDGDKEKVSTEIGEKENESKGEDGQKEKESEKEGEKEEMSKTSPADEEKKEEQIDLTAETPTKKKPGKEDDKPSDEVSVKQSLRKRLWIADGGFTELHAVWAYEEGLMVKDHEFEHWHRRHDYWLLAGVVTHGYRHWQDILGDPRFTMLNRAFRTEADRMRKAAFLNRRFQLLEQALVIEEQLRKASQENPDFLPTIEKPSEEGGVVDNLSQVDNFAATLRRISQGQQSAGNPPDPKIHKAINNLSSLINDIKVATYKTMPATLAKAPPAASPAASTPTTGGQPRPASQTGKKSSVITIDD